MLMIINIIWKILPEFQLAHERNVYKTVALVGSTKKVIENMSMESLQELRTVQKPDSVVEDTLAAVIMIRNQELHFYCRF